MVCLLRVIREDDHGTIGGKKGGTHNGLRVNHLHRRPVGPELRHQVRLQLGVACGLEIQHPPLPGFAAMHQPVQPQEQALMGRPVADLNLSVRARKCMSRLGITTLGELCQRSQEELLESKNFGVTSLNEVRSKLTDLGLKLRGD